MTPLTEFTLAHYRENEEDNEHTENAVQLAKQYGTEEEIRTMEHNRKYYPKLVKDYSKEISTNELFSNLGFEWVRLPGKIRKARHRNANIESPVFRTPEEANAWIKSYAKNSFTTCPKCACQHNAANKCPVCNKKSVQVYPKPKNSEQ